MHDIPIKCRITQTRTERILNSLFVSLVISLIIRLIESISGELNPSGRITDTYVYDVNSSPASENFGDYKYENLDKAYLNYEEGIYVGYFCK